MRLEPSWRPVRDPYSTRVPFTSGSPCKRRRSRDPLPSEGPGPRTGTATRSTRPARSCSGQAGEAGWGGCKGLGTGWGRGGGGAGGGVQEHRGVCSPKEGLETVVDIGAWGVEICILTTDGREAVWGPCPGRAAEGLVVPQRLLGCPTPPVLLSCALHLSGHHHKCHYFWGAAGGSHRWCSGGWGCERWTGTGLGIPSATPFDLPWGCRWAEEAPWKLGSLCWLC